MADDPNNQVLVQPYNALAPLASPQTTVYDFDSSTYLFNRAYSFKISTPSAQAVVGPPAANGLEYTDLRFTFDIEKTAASQANKAKFALYNSALAMQPSANFRGQRVIVAAGYDSGDTGAALPVLFQSAVGTSTARIINSRKGPDVITEFEIGDSEVSIYNTVFDKSYPLGTPYLLVIKDLIGAMGLTANINDPTSLLARALPGSRVVTGPVKQSLDMITSTLNFQWSVQNGVLQLYPKGGSAKLVAEVVSMYTGLIGVPNQNNAEDHVVTFTSLLNAKLDPGSLVQIISATVNGIFTIRKSKYEGDTHGNKWQVTCQCLPVANLFAGVTTISSPSLNGGIVA